MNIKQKIKQMPAVFSFLKVTKNFVVQRWQLVAGGFGAFVFYFSHYYFPNNEKEILITDNLPNTNSRRGFFSWILEVIDIIAANGDKDIKVMLNHTVYNENINENMWEYYFEPVRNTGKKRYKIFETTRIYCDPLLPNKENLRVVLNEIFQTRITVKKSIIDKVENFQKEYFGKKVLGVHFRGTDIWTTIDAYSYLVRKASIDKYFEEIDKIIGNYDSIFLATDENTAFNEFRKRYGKKVFSYSTVRSDSSLSIHHKGENKRLSGEEVLIDAMLLARCDLLFHGLSNVCKMVSIINPKLPMCNLDLKKPRLNEPHFSQHKQDTYIDEKIFRKKRSGFFVDVGAEDGISLSNTYFFEKYRGWKGVCIEPRKETFQTLSKNRNCILENIGLSDKTGTETFIQIEGAGAMLSGIENDYPELHKNRISREHASDLKKKIVINCDTLNNVLAKHGISRVDFLSIDTEGSEEKILKATDFTKIYVETLTVENNYNTDSLKKLMRSKGFIFVRSLGCDEVYLNRKNAQAFWNVILAGRLATVWHKFKRNRIEKLKVRIYNLYRTRQLSKIKNV